MLTDFLGTLTNLLRLRPSTPPPVPPLPALLLGAQQRAGLSVERGMVNILADFKQAGIPTGNYADGTPNYNDVIARIILTELIRQVQEELRVSVAIPPGIALQATGLSAAGPVQVAGTTILPTMAFGVAQ